MGQMGDAVGHAILERQAEERQKWQGEPGRVTKQEKRRAKDSHMVELLIALVILGNLAIYFVGLWTAARWAMGAFLGAH